MLAVAVALMVLGGGCGAAQQTGVVKTTAPTGAATAPVAATEPETPVQHNLKTHPAASEPSFAVRLERVRATARETARALPNGWGMELPGSWHRIDTDILGRVLAGFAPT